MHSKAARLQASKRIALVAHDNMKATLSNWATKHREELEHHRLVATGTTGIKLEQSLKLPIEKFISGPLGGDQQIGANISEGKVDMLVFFWDPFEPLPHDPDVKALLRIAAVWNIPVACNEASADFLLSSPLMREAYERQIPDYDQYLASRKTL